MKVIMLELNNNLILKPTCCDSLLALELQHKANPLYLCTSAGVEHVQQHFQSLSRNKTRDVYYHSAALNDYGDQLLAAEFVR